MYPLKFHPILKERLWGGKKLGSVLGKEIESDITGESWELSAVSGDDSVVSNGPLAGTALSRLIQDDPVALLGQEIIDRFGLEFPILIKFIDASKDLSIQLHPNDQLARERHNSFGKTEMWYIMDSDKDAELIIGFETDVTKEAYVQSLEHNTITDLLHYQKVNKGDTFFINTGKIHAIGAGILLAEIQQTSDITYRVYDFNRKDKNGALRELHTELALDAIDFERKDDFYVSYSKTRDALNTMVDSPYFKTNYLDLTTNFSQDLSSVMSFVIYMCVEGKATIVNEDGEVDIKKGETVLISADTEAIQILTKGASFLVVDI
ncbi:type I phosphomannose isomerase catalytic subunit [Muriicola sp. Z0-33]|uniref:type I phosphomannose isomerase catalytic subunit n=1 Tax=Muriicola sp. Z0-33 TaxID=2816957 RepID=UPI0022372E95|nr:type I phosphomannose isomerase catalytic subunit [Muriicola sp. Z0-33]MCW5517408.1 class I mannose-6-phosphate isomerase [Muriicola sp. Z0-33]